MAGLVKAKKYDWKDSNVAMIGSTEDKKVKKSSAETEPAWKGVKEISGPCVLVWRVKEFKLETVTKEDFGKFYNGDSYIILVVTKIQDKLDYDIFFWIGKHSTADEYGTAAYKTVELDALLDDQAVQHREVEGFESDEFKGIFTCLQILKGGHKSGFRHVDPTKYRPRLLQFTAIGRKCMVKEVFFSQRSLKSDDVFILDLGKTAFQWNGKTSRPMERNKAGTYLQLLETERNGRCKTSVVDETDPTADRDFREHLPNDEVKETPAVAKLVKALYKISDESGELTITLVQDGCFSPDLITEEDVFLIQLPEKIFVYIGRNCSCNEKQNAMAFAHTHLKSSGNPFAPVVAMCGKKHKYFSQI